MDLKRGASWEAIERRGGAIREAYDKSIEVLEKCATPHGFHAAYPGYQGVWARDSMITSLGASLVRDKFKETFKQSLKTLAKHQSKNGQIPNAVLFENGKEKQIDYKSIDSTLWFIIGNYVYAKRYGDKSLLNENKEKIQRALNWLNCQDWGENGLLAQHPTTDWQDAFPHRYGYTINTEALWFYVLSLTGKKKEALEIKKIVNENEDDGLWNGTFYLPWRWKNHNKFHEKGEWFDSLGNLLAIIFELADESKSEKILKHIKQEGIDKPFPMKAIYPPIEKGSKNWHDYFEDCNAREPYCYLNGGIWTFIGGFYVLALVKQKKFEEAEKQLDKLAEANLAGEGFDEWLHGKTGKPSSNGGNQAWNAGMYLLAYESLREKRVLI